MSLILFPFYLLSQLAPPYPLSSPPLTADPLLLPPPGQVLPISCSNLPPLPRILTSPPWQSCMNTN